MKEGFRRIMRTDLRGEEENILLSNCTDKYAEHKGAFLGLAQIFPRDLTLNSPS